MACLVVLLLSLSWVRLAAVYAIALTDSTHVASVRLRDGNLAVVLSHADAVRPFGSTACVRHEHGLAANVLTLFSAGTSTKADHVVSVAAGMDASPSLSEPSALRQCLDPVSFCSSPAPLQAVQPQVLMPMLQPRPPPTVAALLSEIRVTVLLI
jgi:hypothetical protein